jgi:hypothetical protein
MITQKKSPYQAQSRRNDERPGTPGRSQNADERGGLNAFAKSITVDG